MKPLSCRLSVEDESVRFHPSLIAKPDMEGQLKFLLSTVRQREPLDPSYSDHLPPSFRKHIKASVSTTNVIAVGAAGVQQQSQLGVGKKSNVITADVKLRRRLNADLRDIVETYSSTAAGWKRRPNTRIVDIDFGGGIGVGDSIQSSSAGEIDTKLRAAFALRESKEHEQRDLVNASIKAENTKLRRSWGLSYAGGIMPQMAMALPPLETSTVRKRRLDGIAKQLRDTERGAMDRERWVQIAKDGRDMILNPKMALSIIATPFPGKLPTLSTPTTAAANLSAKELADQVAKKQKNEVTILDPEQERQRQIEEASKRERILRERLERERLIKNELIEKEREEQKRRASVIETPRDALHRLYKPIFTALWDMEFDTLGNPFRMVIDASTCADMGLPDYCTIIQKPMNLTYVQTKVNNKSYETLQEFLEDIDLIAKNAMQYNYQLDNPYHIAAKVFRKRFRKLAKPLVDLLTKGLSSTKE